jgi:CheY-like chemotaxis protein
MNTKTAAGPVVLVVDDDAMTRILVIEALEPEGIQIEEAASGAEGIDAFQRRNPDLILLESTMTNRGTIRYCADISQSRSCATKPAWKVGVPARNL